MAHRSPSIPLQHNLHIVQVHVPLAACDPMSPSRGTFQEWVSAQLLLRSPTSPLAPSPPGLDPHFFLASWKGCRSPPSGPLCTFPKAFTSQKHLSGICQ